MKYIFFFFFLLCVIVPSTFADLSPQDLEQIRAIVKEEVKAIVREEVKAEIAPLDARLRNVEQDMAWMRGRFEGIDKQFESIDKQFESIDKQFEGVNNQFGTISSQIAHGTNISYGLIALIVVGIGLPQLLIALRSQKASEHEAQIQTLKRENEAQIQTLKQEIETLKQQLMSVLDGRLTDKS